MKAALMQPDIVWENAQANLAQVAEWLQSMEPGAFDVAVLPELFHGGFSMDSAKLADQGREQVYPVLSELARQYGIYLVAGVALPDVSGKPLNSALVFDRTGKEVARYAKNRLFPLVNEEGHYQAGSEPVIFEIDDTPCSVFTCYDLRFPELFRQVAKRIEAVFVLANWPASRQMHWERLLQARAIENQCFVVGVNRTGLDAHDVKHAGGSLTFDPLGESVLKLGERSECRTAELQTVQVPEVRSRFPFLEAL